MPKMERVGYDKRRCSYMKKQGAQCYAYSVRGSINALCVRHGGTPDPATILKVATETITDRLLKMYTAEYIYIYTSIVSIGVLQDAVQCAVQNRRWRDAASFIHASSLFIEKMLMEAPTVLKIDNAAAASFYKTVFTISEEQTATIKMIEKNIGVNSPPPVDDVEFQTLLTNALAKGTEYEKIKKGVPLFELLNNNSSDSSNDSSSEGVE